MGSCRSRPVVATVVESPSPQVELKDEFYISIIESRRVHSIVRWNKSPKEVEAALTGCPGALNCKDEKLNTPLHIAVQNGHFEIVKKLIELKADINSQNKNGNTALHMSIGYGYYEISKLLINSGADTSIMNDDSFNAGSGITGDKSVAANAVTSAKTASEMLEAIAMLKASRPIGMKKVHFVQAGLKLKKDLEDLWTPKLQHEFKLMLELWDLETNGELLHGGYSPDALDIHNNANKTKNNKL